MLKLATSQGTLTYQRSFLQRCAAQVNLNHPSNMFSWQSRAFSNSNKSDGSGDEAEIKIESDAEYMARKQREDDLKFAHEHGKGTELSYDFKNKRLTLNSYKSLKSDKISTIQIDGQDKTVNMLTSDKPRWSAKEVKNKTMQIITETYLPKDYPESVAKEFLPFTVYSLIGGTSVAAMIFLSTQSLFVALGGTASQSQLAAAAYTWVLKDGIGQLGGILFASRYGGYFDEDVKKWRFFAMSTLNAAILIEIMTLKFPHLFLLLASTANMGKNICFLMAAASRAQINMRFAKRNNIADIAGKAVSLFTTSSLVGMGIGMGLSKLIDISNLSQMAPVFGILTFINLYSTYISANLIDEVHLNNQRAKILFDEYFREGNDKMPTMKEVNDKQTFTVPNFMNWHFCKFIRYGEESISHVIGMSEPNYYVTSILHQLHKEDRKFVYYVTMLPWHKKPFARVVNNGRPYVIQLNMSKHSTNEDQVAAYLMARLLDIELGKLCANKDSNTVCYSSIQNCMRVAELNFSQVDLGEFISELKKADWSLDYIYLDRQKNLYEFKMEHVQEVPTSQTTDFGQSE